MSAETKWVVRQYFAQINAETRERAHELNRTLLTRIRGVSDIDAATAERLIQLYGVLARYLSGLKQGAGEPTDLQQKEKR